MPKIPKKGPRRKSFWHLTVRPTHFSSLLFALLAVLVEFFSLDYYKLGLTEILVDSLPQVQHLSHFFSPYFRNSKYANSKVKSSIFPSGKLTYFVFTQKKTPEI